MKVWKKKEEKSVEIFTIAFFTKLCFYYSISIKYNVNINLFKGSVNTQKYDPSFHTRKSGVIIILGFKV